MATASHPVVTASADCACGTVQVAFDGPPKAMLLCACEDCQKATGSGHSAFIVADSGSVRIEGETTDFARPATSGATLTRSFCRRCGTPISARSSRAPRLVMLPAGLFGAQADWFAPSQLIFARSHRHWDTIAEALPRYETYRGGTGMGPPMEN